MPALSIRIALDCFYLLIFYSEKFSTDVCRLPYAVNVNLNLSIIMHTVNDRLSATRLISFCLLKVQHLLESCATRKTLRGM